MEQKLSDENYFISMNPPMFPFAIIFLYILNHERCAPSESSKYWYWGRDLLSITVYNLYIMNMDLKTVQVFMAPNLT